MSGSWKDSIPAPVNVGLMLLLTDGSVFAQEEGTSQWWRLVPDRAGRYTTGEWRRAAQSASAPLYFASAVLADGTVFIAGGKYKNNDQTIQVNVATAECYDPIADRWKALATPNWVAIGNAPCCVLPDGKVLLGNITAGPCAIWDPGAKGVEAWTITGEKGNGVSKEETWTLLPDGSVLTVDCIGQPAFERFAGNSWIAHDETPILLPLVDNEIGPAILLPDGRVFALGATENTAFYTANPDLKQSGVWKSGPEIPGPLVLCAKNTAACLLPNGSVLCATRPAVAANPVTFFVFNPLSAQPAWSEPLPAPPGQTFNRSYFLLLPTGQVLVSNGTRALQLFQPDGNPEPEWAPSIRDCPTSLQAGASAILKGFQLNGLSQACSGGSNAAMATNYPLVRLRAPFPSDTVMYCRTAKHSTMGIATGKVLHSTEFAVPPATPAGIYYLCVVANGIASTEQLVSVLSRRSSRRALPTAVSQGDEEQIFGEEELFLRDLSEVHLLIDFISGRADKALAGLSDIFTVDSAGATVALTPQRVVEEICMISYPPEGSLEATAQQAAFMLVVKDKLNNLALPARGLTIAFTSMFAGVALPYPKPTSSAEPAHRGRGKFFSAREAYPNLEAEAREFRRLYHTLPLVSIGLLLLIVYTNWDISVTTALQQQIETARTAYTDLFAPGRKYPPTEAFCSQLPDDAEPDALAACNNAAYLRTQLAGSAANLETYLDDYALVRPIGIIVRLFGPEKTDTGATIVTAAGAATSVGTAPTSANVDLPAVKPTGGNRASTATRNSSSSDEEKSDTIARSSLEDFLLAVVSALNTIVIPAAFGFLGTYAGLIRSITSKVRDSILAPRDHAVTRASLPLGMIAGLAVGLFLNNQNAALGQAAGSTITLTAAGLSFLAGFGSETFFDFLTTLLTRLMPPEAPPPATQTVAVPPSTTNKQGS